MRERVRIGNCPKPCRMIGSGAGDCAPAPSHTTGRADCSHPAVGSFGILPSRTRGHLISEHSVEGSAFGVWLDVSQSGVATVVVTPRCFVLSLIIASSVSIGSVRSFGPSLGTPFCSCAPQTLLWPLLTPHRLSTAGSPRVRVGSVRSRLWALQNAVSDCRASRVLACSPPTSCLTAHLCSFGRTFACRPFAPPPCGDNLAVRLRLASLPPSGTFHPDRPDPCRAHERGFATRFVFPLL